MAESAPDLSARCPPLDFDGRTAIRTGERLVHAHSLDYSRNATVSRLRGSRELVVTQCPRGGICPGSRRGPGRPIIIRDGGQGRQRREEISTISLLPG